MEVDLGPDHIVLDGDPAPIPKRGSLQFSAHVCCGQTARWIKMPLDTEVGLGPDDILLDWNRAIPSPLRKGAQRSPALNFGPCLLWPSGWMDQNTTWCGGTPRPASRRWMATHPPTERGTVAPPHFSAHFAVARSPTSTTAEHLSTFHLQTHQ